MNTHCLRSVVGILFPFSCGNMVFLDQTVWLVAEKGNACSQFVVVIGQDPSESATVGVEKNAAPGATSQDLTKKTLRLKAVSIKISQ